MRVNERFGENLRNDVEDHHLDLLFLDVVSNVNTKKHLRDVIEGNLVKIWHTWMVKTPILTGKNVYKMLGRRKPPGVDNGRFFGVYCPCYNTTKMEK